MTPFRHLPLLSALLLAAITAGATVDQYGGNKQVSYATDTTSMAADSPNHRGMVYPVGSGSTARLYVSYPAGGESVDNQHVFTCQGGLHCRDVVSFIGPLTLANMPACPTGYALTGNGTGVACTALISILGQTIVTWGDQTATLPNSLQLNSNGAPGPGMSYNALSMSVPSVSIVDFSLYLASNTHDGVAPAISASNVALLSSNGTSSTWGQLTNPYIAANAGIAVTKLALGGSGYVLLSDGTANQFAQITNQYISPTAAIDWSKVAHPSTFTPSAHASTHVTGGSDVIPDAVSGGNSGLMPGADRLKVSGIPAATTAAYGQLLTPSNSANNAYWLVSPATIGVLTTSTGVQGSGTSGYLPKFTATRTLGNSLLYDNGTNVGIGTNSLLPSALNIERNDALSTQALTLHNPNTEWSAETLIKAYADTDSSSVSAVAFGYFRGVSTEESSGFIVKTGTRDSLTTKFYVNQGGDVDISGALRVRGSSPAAGKILSTVDSDGNVVPKTPAELGLFSTDRALQFASSVTNPPAIISQADTTAAGATGNPFVVQAQNATGSGTTTGGSVVINTGTGTHPGSFSLSLGGTSFLTAEPVSPYSPPYALKIDGSILFSPTTFTSGNLAPVVGYDFANYNQRQDITGGSVYVAAETVIATGSYAGWLNLQAGAGYDEAHSGSVHIASGASYTEGATISPGNCMVVGVPPSGTVECTYWAPATTTTSTGAFNVDITSISTNSGLPDNTLFSVEWTVLAKGGTNRTAKLVSTFSKSGGTLTRIETGVLMNGGSIGFSDSAPNANDMRLAITPPNSTSTRWVTKAVVTIQ